jgi:hypothetical protein
MSSGIGQTWVFRERVILLATITNFQSIKRDGVYGDPVGAGLSGRRIAAMVVNDNASGLVKRGALGLIASKLAPTGFVRFSYFVFPRND